MAVAGAKSAQREFQAIIGRRCNGSGTVLHDLLQAGIAHQHEAGTIGNDRVGGVGKGGAAIWLRENKARRGVQ